MRKILNYLKTAIKYFDFLIGILLIFLGASLIYIDNKIRGIKGKPRNYDNEKSIGVFVPHFNENGQRNCREIVRAKIGAQGDIYVFPHPKNQNTFPVHESFHKTGEFHLTTKQGKNSLAYGEKDLPAALFFTNFRANNPSCFCFRRGKRLIIEEIRALIKNLARYTPSINIEDAASTLAREGIYQLYQQNLFKNLIKFKKGTV